MLKFVFDTNVFVSALMSKRGNAALMIFSLIFNDPKVISIIIYLL